MKFNKLITLIVIIIMLVSVCIIGYYTQYVLTGEDKVAYDLISNVSYNFKNPASVRLVSGCAGEVPPFGVFAFVCLSATNGYGGVTVGYYALGNEEYPLLDVEELSAYMDTSSEMEKCKENTLNVSKINRRLAMRFGN